MRKLLHIALIAALSVCTSSIVVGQEKKGTEKKAASETLKFAEDKLILVTPDTWKSVPPKNNIIQYEFRAPEEGEAFARITFSTSGGSIQQNIDRWIGQFDGTKKDDVKTEKKEIGKAITHTVDITGTFKESMGGGPFAPGPMKKMENYRMLGAIIQLPNGVTIFAKATGPKDIVEDIKPGFTKMVDELKLN